MQYMYEQRGTLSIAALADKVAYSERNVRRLFQQAFGVGPKELMRIIQFQSLLQMLSRNQALPFVEAALQCGYYDQSHVIKSFRAFYGEPPSGVF
ncbi:AraC family transcriptional regulator, partial [Mesorhizobium sp. M00.F.Ca.ET.186.01.1.1]